MRRFSFGVIALVAISCSSPSEENVENTSNTSEEVDQVDPKAMLSDAYQLFKEGNDSASVRLANEVLEIGKATRNDTLVGRALTSLCRNSQRKQDTNELARLSEQLVALSDSTGNQKWVMYMAHMNAEMWRLIGDMDKAEGFYNQSLRISEATGSKGMYTIDHFNKSFVMVAKGNFEEAGDLIQKYYALRQESDPKSEDAYGLIALAYYLEQQQNYFGACEVAIVTRRLFKEQNLFPEPPDEKPLLAVEAKVREELVPEEIEELKMTSREKTVNMLLEEYLQ